MVMAGSGASRSVRHRPGLGVRARQRRAADARQHLHVEDLLHARTGTPGGPISRPVPQVHDADAALQLRPPLGDRHAAERRGLADLRQADEGEAARAGPGRACSRAVRSPSPPGRWPDRPAPAAPPRSRSIQTRPPWTRGECGMAKPRATVWPLATSIRQPLVALSGRQPCGVSVSARAVTYCGRPVGHRQAVEVAAVLGRQGRDERRPPARHEAVPARRACTGRRRPC